MSNTIKCFSSGVYWTKFDRFSQRILAGSGINRVSPHPSPRGGGPLSTVVIVSQRFEARLVRSRTPDTVRFCSRTAGFARKPRSPNRPVISPKRLDGCFADVFAIEVGKQLLIVFYDFKIFCCVTRTHFSFLCAQKRNKSTSICGIIFLEPHGSFSTRHLLPPRLVNHNAMLRWRRCSVGT